MASSDKYCNPLPVLFLDNNPPALDNDESSSKLSSWYTQGPTQRPAPEKDQTTPQPRAEALNEEIPWTFKKDIWRAPSSKAHAIINNAAELGYELDRSEGVAWILHTDDVEEAEECLDLVNATKNDDEANHSLTILLDVSRQLLPEWAEAAEHMPIPGYIGGKLAMKSLYVFATGPCPASMDNRSNTPLVVARPPPPCRLSEPTPIWRDLPSSTPTGPTTGTRSSRSPASTRGCGRAKLELVRIQQAADAKKLWINSCAKAGGLVYFANIIGENRGDSLKEDIGINWVVWHEHESFESLKRQKLGVVLGHGLGLRLRTADPDYKQPPTTWRAKAVPLNYQFVHLQGVFSDLGFEHIVPTVCHRSRRGNDWCFRATALTRCRWCSAQSLGKRITQLS